LQQVCFSLNFKTLWQALLGENFVVVVGWMVVCKPILVFSFDFGQAEQFSSKLKFRNFPDMKLSSTFQFVKDFFTISLEFFWNKCHECSPR
jgi:hypothetical protein